MTAGVQDFGRTELTAAEGVVSEVAAGNRWTSGLKRRVLIQVLRVVLVVGLLAAWQVAAPALGGTYTVSTPKAIFITLWHTLKSGSLWFNLQITLEEMILGLVLGTALGIILGFVLGLNRFLGAVVDPIVTAIYSLPKVALAPLFVVWFGIGLEMKVLLTITIVFFLIFWNVYAGVRDVDPELVDVLRLMGAKRQHILRKVVLPGSVSWIYVGLKLSVPYALVGAVFGELITSNRGVGFVLNQAATEFDTAALFAALFELMVIAMVLNSLLTYGERRLLRWKYVNEGSRPR